MDGIVTREVHPVTRGTVCAPWLRLVLLLLASLPAALCAAPQRPRYVLVISVDGLGWQMLQRSALKLPNIRHLAVRGVIGPAESVFPSNTWPAHVTMVTGCLPRRHGVVGNYFLDRPSSIRRAVWTIPRNQLIRVPTLFDVLRRAGISSAAVLWPGSQGDRAPTFNIPYVYGQDPFERGSTPGLLAELRRAGFPSELLWRFKATFDPHTSDYAAREIARYLVKRHTPRLMLVHLDAPDALAHEYGPHRAPTVWGIEAADRIIGQLLSAYRAAGILGQTAVFVVSDHGLVRATQSFDLRKLLRQGGLLAAKKRPGNTVRVLSEGKMAYLYFLDPKLRAAQVKRVLALLGRRSEIAHVFPATRFHELGLPRPDEDPRVGDLVAVTRDDLTFGDVGDGAQLRRIHALRGVHGDLPSQAGMKTLFVAAGPGIRKLVGNHTFRNVDLAPTILYLLGRAFATAIDGRVIRSILQP